MAIGSRPVTIDGAVPYLWFDSEALQAAEFYVSVFPDSRITRVSHYHEDAQMPKGTVLVVEFELFGRPYAALNGGPEFPHTEAVSFQVSCDTQEEIDRVWSTLIAHGGREVQCGWCKDRWGVNWQVTASILPKLLEDPDPSVSGHAFRAMMQMTKIMIADLHLGG